MRILTALYFLIVIEELCQLRCIETPGLLVHERGLKEHGVGSGAKHALHLLLGHSQAYFLGLRLNDGVLHIRIPHLVLHLIQLILSEVVTPLGHLDNLLVLFQQGLEILHGDFLT